MTGLRSQRSMKKGSAPPPVRNELRLFSREAISLKSPPGKQMSVMGISHQLSDSNGTGLVVYSMLMDRQYSLCRYTTRLVHDNKEGNSALELHATPKDQDTKRVARVVFWDASGDFFLETFNAEIPVGVAEQLIAEAKASIKIR